MYDTARRPFGVIRQLCTWCGTEKPVGEFWRNPTTGWITRECRACAKERSRLWAYVDQHPVATGRRYVDAEASSLLCTRCGRDRPRSAFYTYKSNPDSRRYYRPKCKQCLGAEANLCKTDHNKQTTRRTAERERWLRKKYDISLVEYEDLLQSQGGRCAICRSDEPGGPTPTSAFHVDHCHNTGRIRGLLCRSCNTAIGLLKEDPRLFTTVIAYLSGPAGDDC